MRKIKNKSYEKIQKNLTEKDLDSLLKPYAIKVTLYPTIEKAFDKISNGNKEFDVNEIKRYNNSSARKGGLYIYEDDKGNRVVSIRKDERRTMFLPI